jgi:hypothetical protein
MLKVSEDVKQGLYVRGLYVYITLCTGVLLGLSWLRVEANTCASFCIRSQSGRLSAKKVKSYPCNVTPQYPTLVV